MAMQIRGFSLKYTPFTEYACYLSRGVRVRLPRGHEHQSRLGPGPFLIGLSHAVTCRPAQKSALPAAPV